MNRAVTIALGMVLGYAVFQWGGVVRSDQHIWLFVLGLLAIAQGVGRARRDWAPPPAPALCWAAVLLPTYVLLQVIPLPLAALRVLSPERAAAVDTLASIGAQLHFASLSVSPINTFRQFLLVCGYVVMFLLTRELTSRCADRRWPMVAPIIAIGTLQAALGLWQSLGLGLYQNYGGPGEQPRFGTYANHNHYAGFLEMALPFAIMYPVVVLRRKRSGTQSGLARPLVACGVWATAVTMLLGIVFSLSRMGFISALFALFIMGLLAGGSRLGWIARSKKRSWCAAAVLGGTVLASVLLLPGKLIVRFAQVATMQGLIAEGRTKLWTETLPLIKAYGFIGCGLGGYETAFLRFKISAPLVTDNFAHNDYLQVPAELGLAGCLIVGALAFGVVRAALRGVVASRDQEERYFALACTGALAAIMLHSLADFNLYIPANAMLLAWIAGATLGNRVPGIRVNGGHREASHKMIAGEAVEVAARY